jgi:hypothetical protein
VTVTRFAQVQVCGKRLLKVAGSEALGRRNKQGGREGSYCLTRLGDAKREEQERLG